jgi:glycosyltransferase involved in cell wall biosynthesis
MAARIRVVFFAEAEFVTGPVKAVLQFADTARAAPPNLPRVELSAITYWREGDRPASENPFISASEAVGVSVDIVRERRAFDPEVVPQIQAVVNSHSPDIVETHNCKSHFLMRYAGLSRRYRWIAYHHGYTATDLKNRAINQLDRWSLRAATHIVTVCSPFKKQIERYGVPAERISVHHNSIGLFVPATDEAVTVARAGLPSGAAALPLLVMISRLSREKGHLEALEAFSLLKQRGVAFHAVIVGEGAERGPIEEKRTRLGLTGMVTLVGHKDDVRPYLGLASVYLLPSHSEGSPLALLDAMAAGLPIVASAVGGLPEMLTHDATGLLVPPRDAGALAGAIERLLTTPADAVRLAQNARLDVARFSHETYHRTMLDIYEHVLRQPAGRA